VIATLCHVRARFGWLLGLFVVGCGLAACTTTAGGAHDPRSSAPSSTVQPATSATATPSPTGPKTTGPGVRPGEKPPVLDAIAKEHSALGAHEFAVYYIKALDWGTATADPYLLKQISAPTCKSCKISIDAMTNLESEGGQVEGGRYKIESVETLESPGTVDADYAIKFVLTQDPIVVVHPTATNTVTTKREAFISYVYVSWIRGRWLVIERKGSRS
jgi:hypothetical protein